jgi:hypothetical protein
MDKYYKIMRLEGVINRLPEGDTRPILLVAPLTQTREWLHAVRDSGVMSKHQITFVQADRLMDSLQKATMPYVIIVDDMHREQRPYINECLKLMNELHCQLFMTQVPPSEEGSEGNDAMVKMIDPQATRH